MKLVDEGLRAWHALRSTPGLGPKRLTELAIELRRRKMDAAELLDADPATLEGLGLKPALAQKAAEELREASFPPPPPPGAVLLSPDDEHYPAERLDPAMPLPVLLYAAGNLSLLRAPGIAVAGSRAAAEQALDYAAAVAGVAARAGWNVVSGHAAGIDEAAHGGALQAGGTTTIVLAEGLLNFSPKAGVKASDEDSILVVSGFAPDARWSKYQAMERNSTIAALADVVLIVAAGAKGGSWSQGIACLEAGKKLFVVDFPREVAEGNEALIRKGGVPVSADDPDRILNELTTPTETTSQLGLWG